MPFFYIIGSPGYTGKTIYSLLCVCVCVCVCVHSVVSNSLRPHGLQLQFYNFTSKNTGVGCHFLFRGIFLTQGLNPCLLWFIPLPSYIGRTAFLFRSLSYPTPTMTQHQFWICLWLSLKSLRFCWISKFSY